MMKTIPVTAVVPTANRAAVLLQTLTSMAAQHIQPEEIILVDASDDNETALVCEQNIQGLSSAIIYKKAFVKGAASQRNQGLKGATSPVIFFFDDDIILEPGCVERLWNCLQSHKEAAGVNAMISNQRYHSPGKLTRFMYRLMSGEKLLSYAGKCIGPGWNLLPEDRDGLPECNETEWLNTTCTMYRAAALPDPPFPPQFKGYSLLEDVALSLEVGKKWKLYNARTARIFHNSQPGSHKSSVFALSKMELVNRHHIMKEVLGRRSVKDYGKLFLFEMFGILSVLTSFSGWKNLVPAALGKLAATGTILFSKPDNE